MFLFITFFFLSYLWHMMGVTIGYHRLLAHRSFKCPKLVEYFWVIGGYLAFEGSPIWWAVMHRAHHRYTDTPLDPHAPRYGLRQAQYGWIFRRTYPQYIDPSAQAPDLVGDRLYRFLEQGGSWPKAHALAVLASILFRVFLLLLFGWQVALASALAAVVVQQVPLLLNVVCHLPRLGYKTYATADDSVNVWWVALLTMGEGWHNNHHAFPGSSRSGLKAYEIDVSWLTLRLLRIFRLVSRMNEARTGSLYLGAAPGRVMVVAGDRGVRR